MSSFKTDGYTLVKNLLDVKTIKTISQYFENKINRGEWVELPTTTIDECTKLKYYADPLIEVMLTEYKHAIEQHTGLLLEPTYSMCRVYQGGEELFPHTDRPSCEVSATINVACTGDTWPIWMQYKDKDPVKFMLNPGDAIIYKGCDVMHWRRILPEGQINVQFMLHYIAKNGPYVEYKFDRRTSLGLPFTEYV
jgi:hypothetical protein